MNIKTWVSENKLVTTFLILFIAAFAGLGWLIWTAWDDYASAATEYDAKSAELADLSKGTPFPSASNLKKLVATLNQSEANLEKLRTALSAYHIAPFGNIAKAKPQDQPQTFQDALRTQVTAIKTLSATSGSTLTPSFYLGLEEYENKLPSQAQTVSLARQLTVLNWLAKTIASQRGTIMAEFARITEEKKMGTSAAPSTPVEPYETVGNFRVTLRCEQTAFRDLVNALAAAPYFLVIESLQIQNSNGEPPRRDALPQQAAIDQPTDVSGAIRRIPIIVGRESLNVFLKIRAFDFPDSSHPAEPSK